MATNSDQNLPTKEAGLFRQVVKHYESKQYKKGIKAADQVLKRFPNHGETLAMKGLIIAFQEKAEAKAEAEDLVRRGLKANLKSHVCWHVYGLLHRADNNYDEATKCYKNALRFDKENLQILRDLAQLQIQTREYAGYIETRKILLGLKASNRQNWISLAVAYHLNEDYETAVNILSGYEGVQEGVVPGEEYEHSEMLLYKAQVLEEGGMTLEALSCLEASREHLKDTLTHREAKARLLLKLVRYAEAAGILRTLLSINPDNYKYHQDLRRALGLTSPASGAWSEKQQQELEALYEGLVHEYPRSQTPPRMQLDFLEGEAFEKAVDKYVRRFLVKGIPSLFSDLKSLYSSSGKAAGMEVVLLRILEALQKDPGRLPPLHGESEGQDAGEALLWTQLFLARHFDRLRQTGRALQLLAECESQHPEVLEIHMAKSTILKHAGDLEGSAAAGYKAQSLDRADRYLNGAAAKALFRAGHIDTAQRLAWLFINAADPAQTLHDMQCMWYQIELGTAYLQAKDHGRALKNLLAVTKHFATFQEDQFDFHTYCMRKMTLRNYVNLLRMEDNILQNSNYAKAAFGAVETYLSLADKAPGDSQSLEEEEALLASLSLEERKKHKLRRKKEAQKKAKEEDRRKEAAEEAAAAAKARESSKGASKGNKADKPAAKDPDPNGTELASTSDPLGEASKLLVTLRQHAGSQLRTHTLSFEVAIRRGKRLLALQAVKRGVALVGPSHPEVHRMVVVLAKEVLSPGSSHLNGVVKAGTASPSEIVAKQLKHNLESILGDKSLEEYHKSFVEAHRQTSLPHATAAAELNALLGLESSSAAAEALANFNPATEGPTSRQVLQASISAHKVLKGKLSDSKAADSWKQRCRQRFPYSQYFEGEKQTPSSVLQNLFADAAKSSKK